MVVMGDFFGELAGVDESCFCRGGYGALPAFFHKHFRATVCGASGARICLATCASAAAALPAVAPLRILGGFAGNGRRFCHELWTSVQFSAGECSLSASPTWGNADAGWRFGLIWPAKPPRSCKWGSLVLRGAHEDVQLRRGGTMPSASVLLLNAATGIRWQSSGAFVVLAVIRDLGSRKRRGMALKDRRIHLCSRQTICGPHS